MLTGRGLRRFNRHFGVSAIRHNHAYRGSAAVEVTDAYAIEADFAATIDQAVAAVITEAIATANALEGAVAS